MTGLDEHLESLASLSGGEHTCAYCHCLEDNDYLFLHEASGDRLCQKCLGLYLQKDIEDSSDHAGYFEGWTFQQVSDGWRKAANDGIGYYARNIHAVVEAVLMRLKKI